MEYYEANPLPLVCKVCEASGNVDCGECEHALERFQRRIAEINEELEKLSNE